MHDELSALKIIRDGDNVFLINNWPTTDQFNKALGDFEHFSLRFHEYRCPFSIIEEFDNWFEWKRREYFLKQSTGTIMCDMVSDVERIKEHEIMKPVNFRLSESWAPIVHCPKSVIMHGVF